MYEKYSHRIVCEANEVAVKSVMARRTKRRFSGERESPSKKRRSFSNVTDVSKPTEVAVEAVTARETKRQ